MTVRMIHPDLPGQSKDDVHPDAVPHLATSGWQIAPPVEVRAPARTAAPAATETAASKRQTTAPSTGKE